VGPERGYGVTGLLGGLISSTAVTLTFAKKSREDSGYAESLALGVVTACTVLIPKAASSLPHDAFIIPVPFCSGMTTRQGPSIGITWRSFWEGILGWLL
jgi:hypothetical protein